VKVNVVSKNKVKELSVLTYKKTYKAAFTAMERKPTEGLKHLKSYSKQKKSKTHHTIQTMQHTTQI